MAEEHLGEGTERQTRELTREERRAQRRSWVIGDMMFRHPELTKEEAGRIVDRAIEVIDDEESPYEETRNPCAADAGNCPNWRKAGDPDGYCADHIYRRESAKELLERGAK